MASEIKHTLHPTFSCEICERPEPSLHCNTCRTNVCRQCIGEHLTSQLTINHNVVAFDLRDKGVKHPLCQKHANFWCELHCENCSMPVCSQCCADSHDGHPMTDIRNLYKIKQKMIELDNYNLETVIKEYQRIITAIKEEMSKLSSEYRKIATCISNQGEIWHREINNIIQIYLSKIDYLESNDLSILEKQLRRMQNELSNVCLVKQKGVESLNDGMRLAIYESTCEAKRKIPSYLYITKPSFKPNAIKPDIVSGSFGPLAVSVKSVIESYNVKMILATPVLLKSVNIKQNNMIGIASINTEQMWIILEDKKVLLRMDIDGSICESVTTNIKHPPYDITVNDQGHLVYTVFWGDSVFLTKHKKPEAIIKLENWYAHGICSTSDGDLLVCMTSSNNKKSKVVRYHGTTVKNEIMQYDDGRNLYGTGSLFITESSNKDIWVSDRSARAVVVTDALGNFKFIYSGDLCTISFKTFSPIWIDSDSLGHVLVTDRDNHCIHIIDQSGCHLCFIRNLESPRGLSIDIENRVWVCEKETKRVKLLKYID